MKTIRDIHSEIMQNNVSHYNIFFGEEIAVQNIYINKICELGFNKIICESVKDAIEKSTVNSIDDTKFCYIVTDDTDYIKSDKYWKNVKEIFENSNNILILKLRNIDKRNKIYKSEDAIEFTHLSDSILSKYITKIIPNLSYGNQIDIIHNCKNDYTSIFLNIDKLVQYNKLLCEDINDTYEYLMSTYSLSFLEDNLVYRFVDAILYGSLDNAYSLLYYIKANNENMLGILSLLYMNFKNMLLYQGLGTDKSDAEIRTGLSTRQINNIIKLQGGYKTQELKNALITISNIEQGIKCGTFDSTIALDYALIKIMG